jgi:hypothetical protein
LAQVVLVVLLIIKADLAMTQYFQLLHQMAVAVGALMVLGLLTVMVVQVRDQVEILMLERVLLIKDTREEKTLPT